MSSLLARIGPKQNGLYCTAILQFARGLRGFLTQQEHKADRIMAGQNYGESNTGAPLLNDSLISGCGYAALCSIAVVGAHRLAVVLTDCAFRRFTNSGGGMSLGACV